MSPTLKRTLLILGLLIFAALVGYGLYILFKSSRQTYRPPSGKTPSSTLNTLPGSANRGATTTAGGGQGTGGSGTLPRGGTNLPQNNPTYFQPQAVTKLTTDYTLYPSVNSRGNLRYHNGGDGKFYTVDGNGTAKALSEQVFYNVKDVTWAPKQDKAVIAYPDGSKIVYNFELKKQITLPKHWENFSFSSDGTEIAAKSIALSPENRWLVTTKDDGTGTQLIEPLGENGGKVRIDWSPSRQTVAFAQTGAPQGGERREVLLIGLHNENFKSLIVEGLNFEPAWSQTGKKLLYSVDSARTSFKPELWIVSAYGDTIGSERRSLEVNTWAHKCAFATDDTVYCAVPRNLPDGAGMAPSVANDTTDELYRIDLKTGLRTPIQLGSEYTIDHLSYNQKDNKLFFTDAHQNGAFAINL